jgi:hypothetical protein
MIYVVIVFDVYWVLRVINFSFYLLIAWRRFRLVQSIQWREKLMHDFPMWRSKQHVVFLTVYNEEWKVVETALRSVCAAAYDPSVMTIVIAGEARTAEHFYTIFTAAQNMFGASVGRLIGTLHPADLPDEIPGKGSNLHYAEQEIKKFIDAEGWHYRDVIVTVFDIDTVCHEQYFAYLTYLYLQHPNPTHSSF